MKIAAALVNARGGEAYFLLGEALAPLCLRLSALMSDILIYHGPEHA